MAEVEIQIGMRFDGSLYEWLITDATYASQNTHINRVVYSQFAVATSVGTARHLIEKYEENKNGYGAWNALCKWYNSDSVRN